MRQAEVQYRHPDYAIAVLDYGRRYYQPDLLKEQL